MTSAAMNLDPDGRLSREEVAIVGVGGTGSHILDYLCKTPVGRIDLYDADCFTDESARRSPGAFNLIADPKNKAAFHASRYADLHPNIRWIDRRLDAGNVDELGQYTTVFLCIDSREIKRRAIEVCMTSNAILIHVGMSVRANDDARLFGLLTVTTCLPEAHDHAGKCIVLDGSRPTSGDTNWQTIELNALNAALAVIKWKKLIGIFCDRANELRCVYGIARDEIYNQSFKS